jgi:hypothetical protein
MRRSVLAVSCGVLLWLALPLALNAQFTYTTNNGTITITGYTGPGGAVVIPDTIHDLPVVSIGDNAFNNCRALTGITIPDSVTYIGGYAFSGTSLTSVLLGSAVEKIGDGAFKGCTSLRGLEIPNGVASLGARAFMGCTSLTSLRIPSSVTSMGDSVFFGCANLGAIEVDVLNPAYSSVQGVVFDKNQTVLIAYPGGRPGDYTIPNGVTRIDSSAFAACAQFAGVVIPNSVTDIDYSAFYGCTGLTNVTIPDGVADLGWDTFYSCTNLASVSIGNRVTDIGGWAFGLCTSLPNVTLPDSVTNIGPGAFFSCASLTRKGSVPVIDNTA